jgi:hypothetical protein
VPFVQRTSAWPKYKDPSGAKLVDTLLINEGKPMQLELYSDADVHPQVAGNDNDVEVGGWVGGWVGGRASGGGAWASASDA